MIQQALNPITRRWVKLDTFTASIVAHKKSPGPYKGIQIYGQPIKIAFLSRKKIAKRKGQERGVPRVSFLAGRRLC